jgi:hypothetical protein
MKMAEGYECNVLVSCTYDNNHYVQPKIDPLSQAYYDDRVALCCKCAVSPC